MPARPTGLEPATTGSTVRYSNQLSYGPSLHLRAELYLPPIGSQGRSALPNLGQSRSFGGSMRAAKACCTKATNAGQDPPNGKAFFTDKKPNTGDM